MESAQLHQSTLEGVVEHPLAYVPGFTTTGTTAPDCFSNRALLRTCHAGARDARVDHFIGYLRCIRFVECCRSFRQSGSVDAGGDGQWERLLNESPNEQFATDWTRDGRYLRYSERDPKTGSDINAIFGCRAEEDLGAADAFCRGAGLNFSLNGKWIACQSDESGRKEMFVEQPFKQTRRTNCSPLPYSPTLTEVTA